MDDEPVSDTYETDDERDAETPDETNDEPVAIPITDTLDLHPFRPGEIRDVASEYLIAARDRGFRQVRLIHGRGIGMQRENIRKLLASLDYVEAFQDADGSGGGWGATVVVLRARGSSELDGRV